MLQTTEILQRTETVIAKPRLATAKSRHLMLDQPATCSSAELLWDLPNINATISDVVTDNGKHRCDYAALAGYLGRVDAERVSGTIFLNLPSDPIRQEGFVAMLRRNGFGVYARPRVDGSDIDDNLVAHVEARAGRIAKMILGTHDKELIKRCMSAAGPACAVTVVGFAECSSFAISNAMVEFVDLEDIDRLFAEKLPRRLLGRLPVEGSYLEPLGAVPGRNSAGEWKGQQRAA